MGDEIGCSPGIPTGREGRVAEGSEEEGRRAADSLPAARHPPLKDLQGPERGELRNRPCSGKGTGLLLELVGKLGTGGIRELPLLLQTVVRFRSRN